LIANKAPILKGFLDADGAVAAGICLHHIYKIPGFKAFAQESDLKQKTPFQIKGIKRTNQDAASCVLALRQHYKECSISKKTIDLYEDFIDIAYIAHTTKYTNKSNYNGFLERGHKLQNLFNFRHNYIDRQKFYSHIVHLIAQNPSIDDFFDADPLFEKIIQ